MLPIFQSKESYLGDGEIEHNCVWYPLGGSKFRRIPILEIWLEKGKGVIMVKRVEIYFRDLIPEAQSRLLKEFETTAEQENWDVFTIAEIERELEDGNIPDIL